MWSSCSTMSLQMGAPFQSFPLLEFPFHGALLARFSCRKLTSEATVSKSLSRCRTPAFPTAAEAISRSVVDTALPLLSSRKSHLVASSTTASSQVSCGNDVKDSCSNSKSCSVLAPLSTSATTIPQHTASILRSVYRALSLTAAAPAGRRYSIQAELSTRHPFFSF